ncbi:MAG: tyrosinase family protein [Actinomycetota bacterium]|nr:tyrosinase family protein [Actinomycetota bacterium]
MGIRKNYRRLSEVERDRFVQALRHVKSNGIVDEFADLHATHFGHGIHRSSHFLPWHREFLLRFENELRTHHPDVTIPYWDSTVDRSPSDPLWNNSFLGQFNTAWNLRRRLGSDTLPTAQQVRTNRERDTYDRFWPELESDIHNPPHRWVGGVMAGAASPGDPVFYLHHGWIDLLWVLWQLARPGAPFVSSGPGAGLNDDLMGWPGRTPAEVLDHYALGYSYDIEPVLQVEGRLSFLRAHDIGTKFGPAIDQLDVEVVVQLDTQPGRAFGFQLRADGNEAARRAMLDALRTAFNDDRRLRLDYQRTGVNNGVLLRVADLS